MEIGKIKRPEVVEALNKFIAPGNHCLEIGAGIGSTPLLRKIVTKNNGYVLSIETSIEWYTKIKDVCPDSKYGKTILTKVVADTKQSMPLFDYKLTDTYDIVFVDGPSAKIYGSDKKWTKLQMKWFSNASAAVGIALKRKKRVGGLMSMFVGHYIWDHLKIGGYIIVDKRLLASLYYLKRFPVQHLPIGKTLNKAQCSAIIQSPPGDCMKLSNSCNVFRKLR